MIKLSRVNDEELVLNEEYIESMHVNSDRDTVVKLHNGTTYTIKNSPDQIMGKIAEWNRYAAGGPELTPGRQIMHDA